MFPVANANTPTLAAMSERIAGLLKKGTPFRRIGYGKKYTQSAACD